MYRIGENNWAFHQPSCCLLPEFAGWPALHQSCWTLFSIYNSKPDGKWVYYTLIELFHNNGKAFCNVCASSTYKSLVYCLIMFVPITENEVKVISRNEKSTLKAPGCFSFWCNLVECTSVLFSYSTGISTGASEWATSDLTNPTLPWAFVYESASQGSDGGSGQLWQQSVSFLLCNPVCQMQLADRFWLWPVKGIRGYRMWHSAMVESPGLFLRSVHEGTLAQGSRVTLASLFMWYLARGTFWKRRTDLINKFYTQKRGRKWGTRFILDNWKKSFLGKKKKSLRNLQNLQMFNDYRIWPKAGRTNQKLEPKGLYVRA